MYLLHFLGDKLACPGLKFSPFYVQTFYLTMTSLTHILELSLIILLTSPLVIVTGLPYFKLSVKRTRLIVCLNGRKDVLLVNRCIAKMLKSIPLQNVTM